MADISPHQDGGGIGRRYRARASALFFSHSSGWRQGTHLGGGPPDRGPVKSDFVRQATLYNFVSLSHPPI